MKLFKSSGWVICLLMFINPWLWVIVRRDVLVGFLSFALSIFFLYFCFKNKKLLIPIIVLTGVLVAISLKGAFDESIFRNSALDIQQLNRRHEYLAQGLGKIYTNRFSLSFFKDFSIPLIKIQKNFFSNLDINLYFFASHPRERAGVEEFNKYWPIFLPFFIAGILYVIYKRIKIILIYILIVSSVSAFISSYYNLGPILFFPVVNVIITLGILYSLKKIGVKSEI